MCELFYQAVQLIPNTITEYTISCTNDKGTSTLKIGILDELDDDGEISIAKIVTPYTYLILNKDIVHNFYISNRTSEYNVEDVQLIISLLEMGGYEPIIKTSYKTAFTTSKK